MSTRNTADPGSAPASAGAVFEFHIPGMHCSHCVSRVTDALRGVPGVASVAVDLERRRAAVRGRGEGSGRLSGALLVEVLRQAGYEAQPVAPAPAGGPEGAGHRLAGWGWAMWVGVAGTVPLMLGEWALGWGGAPWFGWVSWGLATVVQAVAGASFYRGAWGQLKAGRSNMDTLVALGSTTAYAYSVWALWSGAPGHLYFMEAAAIITVVSVGHWLEARVSARASGALRDLLRLAPATARRRTPDGGEVEVPVAELHVGDRVVLKPGDRVPTDGQVLEGESAVDESMLTGESVPADKAPGALLCAGTVTLNGRLVMRVTATGEGTVLAHIIEAVRRAQTSRANIQRLADRISNVFVPAVVLVALATALGWALLPETLRGLHAGLAPYLWAVHLPGTPLASAVIGAAAVLIIACPCAMGLATPAAIMAGSNAAARRGILIRDGVALEKAGRVTTVIFDKTGTLTAGRPVVAAFEETGPLPGELNVAMVSSRPSPPVAPRELPAGAAAAADDRRAPASPMIRLAAALARHSTHPFSQAVVRLADASLPVRDWEEVRGAGVQGRWGGGRPGEPTPLLRLGSLNWLGQCGVDTGRGSGFAASWTAQGATVLGVAVDGALAGVIALRDMLKPGALAVVRRLQNQGLRVCLVTGDNPLTAAEIARQCGIPRELVSAEVRPEQKSDRVRAYQHAGQRVAFVGDGINDAPALEQADLGIAVARASDIAREAADMILLNSEIEAVPEALGLARATLRTIKQNLFWAFFYNSVGVPLAALGFLSPVVCALAMGMSDLVVIGNALRLRGWKAGVR
ncbi:MAG: cation-translocating P-type ATPase [Verrucomicrobia bacterium]|nr:cation-translocating P-type ATPase [Verrucomicrobiota bacterium]